MYGHKWSGDTCSIWLQAPKFLGSCRSRLFTAAMQLLALCSGRAMRLYLQEHNLRVANRGVVPPLFYQLGTALSLTLYLFKRDEVRTGRLFPVLHEYLCSLQAACSQLFGAQVLQDWSLLQLPELALHEQWIAEEQLYTLSLELVTAKTWLADLIGGLPDAQSVTFVMGLEAACHSLAPIAESLQDGSLLQLLGALVAVRPLVDERRARMAGASTAADPDATVADDR